VSRFSLDRRTVLRGLLGGTALSVALPPLEAMLGVNGDAWADGTDLPTRFGIWFWGNGVRSDKWVPLTTGAGWTPNEETAPLLEVRDHLSVVSGCEIKTATHPHHSGMTGIFTGRKYHQNGITRDTIVTTFASQSVDQIAADHFSGQAPFRSLEFGVTRFHGTDEGTTFQHLSHNGPNNPNPCEYDPQVVFDRLFGVPTDSQLALVRGSVLDAVMDQSARLERRLGAADRARLEQHLESIRALETRLDADLGACGFGDPPGAVPDVSGQEQIYEKNQVMSELLALALACDLTRVFSVQFSTAGSGVVFWEAGATEGLHGTCHTESLPQPTVHAATTLTMGYLRDCLVKLRDVPVGDGNLLDHCSILCCSELTDGYTHSNADFPILVAGKGGGRLRGGMHYRSTSAENTSHAVLSALRGAGVDAADFGADEGHVTTGISAIEA
jgi:hypothetical protein